jgi:hypothetical protein
MWSTRKKQTWDGKSSFLVFWHTFVVFFLRSQYNVLFILNKFMLHTSCIYPYKRIQNFSKLLNIIFELLLKKIRASQRQRPKTTHSTPSLKNVEPPWFLFSLFFPLEEKHVDFIVVDHLMYQKLWSGSNGYTKGWLYSITGQDIRKLLLTQVI